MSRKGLSKDWGVIEQIFREGEILTLSLSDGKGAYGVPLNYGYSDGKIYIHSSGRGRKYEALTQGTEVCFSIVSTFALKTHEKPCKWGSSFMSAVGFGQPRLIDDEKEKLNALSVIMDQYGEGKWDFDPAGVKIAAVFEILVDRATARVRD